jgi:chaperonin GroEL
MAKQLIFDQDAREALKRGVTKMVMAVKPTLGPRGRSAVLDKGWGAPTITKDGASVTEEVEFQDPYENMGAQMVKEAATKTGDEAGDGTTTAALLAEVLYTQGLKYITSGANPAAIVRGIKASVEAVVKELKESAEELQPKDKDRIIQVATIAANGDTAVGNMMADLCEKVGKEGAITIEEGKGIETEIKVVEGMQFDRGFISPYFVTDETAVEARLENPYILIHEDKISSVSKLIPIMEKVAAEKRALLIIAEDIEGEALATLVVNKLRGILPCCGVKAPGYGDRRKAMMEDIAILTGGKVIFKDLGIDLAKVRLDMLGQAKKVIVDSENTTIVEGKGALRDIQKRAEQIRKEYQKSDSDYDREKLQERLSKLTGGVAQINVGAATETELKERKQRVDNAYHAVKGAFEEGIVPGGGVALIRAQKALENLELTGDEGLGREVVRKTLQAPLRQIVENAGWDGGLVLRRVLQEGQDFGFDVEKGEFVRMKQAGIIDPVKVVRHAILSAASVACILLLSDAMVSEEPEKEEKKGTPHHHMGY